MSEIVSVKKGKTNGYKSNIRAAKQARKHEEAEIRNDKYHAMTIKEKIAYCKSNRGESKIELARLNKLLLAEVATAALTSTAKK